jgi:hypothetical protein
VFSRVVHNYCCALRVPVKSNESGFRNDQGEFLHMYTMKFAVCAANASQSLSKRREAGETAHYRFNNINN